LVLIVPLLLEGLFAEAFSCTMNEVIWTTQSLD
jgi:hypothetical protein